LEAVQWHAELLTAEHTNDTKEFNGILRARSMAPLLEAQSALSQTNAATSNQGAEHRVV
jgi:hypothetical protein